ncbi:MAG TPA: choice-of-anchor L domain-containing protein [Chitinophagales bacterium]|nr:choice-of-anchor L domain-containing protein [Chitinophagales bacterium]
MNSSRQTNISFRTFAASALIGVFLCACVGTRAQSITGVTDANQLAQTLAGAGVTVTNATLNCGATASAIFDATGTSLPITNGIVLTSGVVDSLLIPNCDAYPTCGWNYFNSGFSGTVNDPDLDQLVTSGLGGFDGCVLEFDVFVTADTLRFNYIWGSEEYHEYVGSQFNDVFGFFLSGPGIAGPYSNSAINLALIPSTTTPVAINNINCGTNASYYICNDQFSSGSGTPTCTAANACPTDNTNTTISYDGFTVKMTAEAIVIPCETYHLKLAIQDVGDAGFDSGVFIETGSLSSVGVQIIPTATYVNPINGQPTAVEGCVDAMVKVRLSFLPTDTVNIPLQIGGDAIFGVDYTYGGSSTDSITFMPNDSVEFISIVPLADGIAEGMESIYFIYQPQFCASAPLDTVVLNIADFMEADATNDTVMCLDNPIELTVNGGTSIEFEWTPSAGLSCTDCQSPTANPTVTTTYHVTISAGSLATCVATDSVVVTVVNVFADAGPDLSLCLGDTLALSTPAVTGLSYEWLPDIGLACSSCASTEAFPITPTTYTVHTFAGQCDAYDTVVVNVTVPVADAGPDLSLCFGDSLQLQTVTQASQVYQWSPANALACETCDATLAWPSTTTTFTVTASLGTCFASDSIVVNVVQVIAEAGPDVSICPWFDTLLVGSGGATYSWSPAAGLSATDAAQVIAQPAVTTTYILTASSSGFVCSDQDTVVVNVVPGAAATISNDTTICFGQEANLLAGGGVSYEWGPLDAMQYLSAYNISDPVATPYDSTQFTVVVTDANGCKDTASTNVNVYPDPFITVSGPHLIYKGESVTLNATGGAAYIWQPDSTLQLASTAEPIATPPFTTNYTVMITTENGCIYLRDVLVLVQGETFVIAPNAFSPNGDGTNDRFNFIARGIFTLQNFSIFDRWGELVFRTDDADLGWDGTFKGNNAELGVYVYMIEGIDVNNQTLVKYGNLLLLR